MQSVEIHGLEEFDCKLQNLLKNAPEKRRRLHEEIAEMTKAEVDNSIGGTGKVASWQEKAVGSGGGYAAVRPKAKTYIYNKTNSKKYAVGYVTNAIENGHAIRNPKNLKTRRRIKVSAAKGRAFYASARVKAETQAIQMCRDFAEKLTDELR
ncbi:MAG: hypothetical protein LKJ25_01005 [Clostridia bacterium]|jgi:hypothetical protein|nr:hypothetical protein [Clostridia bacterium]